MTQTAPDAPYSIQTRGLNLWYEEFQALKNVDVNIRRSVITALIGPSGCGKTTFLRCFNRLNERYGRRAFHPHPAVVSLDESLRR